MLSLEHIQSHNLGFDWREAEFLLLIYGRAAGNLFPHVTLLDLDSKLARLRPFDLRKPHAADFFFFAEVDFEPTRSRSEVGGPAGSWIAIHGFCGLVAGLVELAGGRDFLP